MKLSFQLERHVPGAVVDDGRISESQRDLPHSNANDFVLP